MKWRRAVPRPQADRDVDSALTYYATDNPKVARDFLKELQHSLVTIGEMPSIGSKRFAGSLNIPGLRVFPMTHFPFIIFYSERNNVIDVLRILHMHRDIVNLLLEI